MAGLVPAIHVFILKWPQRGRPAPVPYGIGPPGPAWLFVLLACMERARTAEHRSSDENSLEFSWPHLAWVNDAA